MTKLHTLILTGALLALSPLASAETRALLERRRWTLHARRGEIVVE